MIKKRILSLIIALIMALSVCPVMAEEQEFATRLYTIEQFIYSIGTNNLASADGSSFTFPDWNDTMPQDREVIQIALENQIIKGYDDGSIRPYEKILRIEAFVMLSRALTTLPATGEPIEFADTPSWAKGEVDRLSAAGLVKGTGNGYLGAEDYITKEQVLILAQRIDSLYTKTDKKDDFYNTVNAKWMRNNNLRPGYLSWSTIAEIEDRNNKVIEEIIKGYANEKEGSIRKKAYDYYLSAADMDKRNADGAKPIKPYLKMLDAARTINDIIEVMGNIAKDNYMFSLLPVAIAPDELNTDNNLVTIYGADTGISAYYLMEDPQAQSAFREYLITLFRLAGEDDGNLESRIGDVLSFDTTLAASSLNYYEYLEFENRYNEYTPESFANEFKNINLEHYFNIMGMELPQRFIVEETAQMAMIDACMTSTTANLLKDYIKACLLCDSAPFLSEKFLNAQAKFNQTFFEAEGQLTRDEEAIKLTDQMFGMVIGMDFMQRCYQSKTTEEITLITSQLIQTYKDKISTLDWLSKETKEAAIKKLDNIRVKIGGPGEFTDYYTDAKILAPDNNGTLFYNTAKISSNMFRDDISQIDKTPDKNQWFVTPQTVNAFYSPTGNEIVLPAAILQEPMYSPDYSYEQNLGAIGSIIAHELSHAFDSSGALYDEKGNYKQWWTEQDFAEFESRADKVADRFSQIEVIDGYFVNGDYTLNENIADLGAVSCIIATANKQDGFDYAQMFESYASSWAEIIPDKNLITSLIVDEHAPAKVRVNGVLQNFEEFYQTYNITSADKMYLSPDQRVKIW